MCLEILSLLFFLRLQTPYVFYTAKWHENSDMEANNMTISDMNCVEIPIPVESTTRIGLKFRQGTCLNIPTGHQ